MPSILRPDLKAVVWLALGFFAAPKLMSMIRQ